MADDVKDAKSGRGFIIFGLLLIAIPVALGVFAVKVANVRIWWLHRNAKVSSAMVGEATKVLERGPKFEIYSIICERPPKKDEPTVGRGRYPIKTKKSIGSMTERHVILEAIYQDIADGSASAKCFEPHHAVRAEKKGKVVELIICYKCSAIQVDYEGETASAALKGNSKAVLDGHLDKTK